MTSDDGDHPCLISQMTELGATVRERGVHAIKIRNQLFHREFNSHELKEIVAEVFFYFLWPKTFFVWLIERQFFKLMWRTIKKIIIFSSICMNVVVVRLSRIIFQAQESERAIGDGEKMKFMIV